MWTLLLPCLSAQPYPVGTNYYCEKEVLNFFGMLEALSAWLSGTSYSCRRARVARRHAL